MYRGTGYSNQSKQTNNGLRADGKDICEVIAVVVTILWAFSVCNKPGQEDIKVGKAGILTQLYHLQATTKTCMFSDL